MQVIVLTLAWFIAILAPTFSLGNHRADSLSVALRRCQSDTLRITLLLRKADAIQLADADSGLILTEQAIQLANNRIEMLQRRSSFWGRFLAADRRTAETANAYKQLCSAYKQKGIIYRNTRKYSKAIESFNSAIGIATKANNKQEVNASLLGIGLVYQRMNEIGKSDSILKRVVRASAEAGDSISLMKAYNNLGGLALSRNNYDSALIYFTKTHAIAKALNSKLFLSQSENNLGAIHYSKGNLNEALEYFRKSIALNQETGNERDLAFALSNLGLIYRKQGRYAESIEVLLRSQTILERSGNRVALASCYTNLGNAYSVKDLWEQSLQYYLKALAIDQELDNHYGQATSYLNLGVAYTRLRRISEALDTYRKGIEIQKKLDDREGLTKSYIGLGELYLQTVDHKLSKFYYDKAIKLVSAINNPSLNAEANIGYTRLLLSLGDFDGARTRANMALRFAHKSDETSRLVNSIELLAEIYERCGRYKEAYLYQLQGYKLLDSISKRSKNELIANVEASYIAENRQLELQTLSKERELQNMKLKENETRLKRQRAMLYLYLVGFVGMLLLGFIFFHQARHKKHINTLLSKQNREIQQKNEEITAQRDEIEAQRDEIEAQRNDIARQKAELEKLFTLQTDSILFAQQIQNAILPDSYVLHDNLKEHFVIYRPKDIVSGDFYWLSPIGGKIAITVADCTGHGVPGAMLSMLGASLLNEMTARPEEIDPGDLLTELRSYMIMSLWQRGLSGALVYGMDLAFCLYDPNTLELRYAGANIPVYIYTGDVNGYQLVELQPDKMPIAMSIRMNTFNTRTYQLKQGDRVYMLTDGFTDQLGGPNMKKYSLRRFKELIQSICHLPLTEQERIISDSLDQWRNGYQQIDDITVMAFVV